MSTPAGATEQQEDAKLEDVDETTKKEEVEEEFIEEDDVAA
jgi:hypothetical protein